jgi:hypothetical protein
MESRLDYKLTLDDQFKLWKFGVREGFSHLDRHLRDICYPAIRNTLSKKDGLKSLLEERVPLSILDEIIADIVSNGRTRPDSYYCYHDEDSDDSNFW